MFTCRYTAARDGARGPAAGACAHIEMSRAPKAHDKNGGNRNMAVNMAELGGRRQPAILAVCGSRTAVTMVSYGRSTATLKLRGGAAAQSRNNGGQPT